LREHSSRESGVADPDREVRIPDDERNDLRARAADVEALVSELVAERCGIGCELLHATGLLLEQLERGERAGDRRRGKRRREDERARRVDEVAGHCAVAGHERAVGAERLPERADDHVDLVLEARLGDSAAPAGTDGSGPVSLVDHHAQPVARRKLDDPLERRHVAVHREHAVGDDQRPTALRLLDAPLEMVEIAVVVDEHVGAREPAAVDDRGVVELIGEHDVAGASERRGHADVGEVARAEQQRRLAALERGEALLEAAMDRHRARDQARRACADAPPHRRVGGRRAHTGMIGQAEVVIRAQQQYRLAVEQHVRPLRSADETSPAMQPEGL
jgi:hypothetical protein